MNMITASLSVLATILMDPAVRCDVDNANIKECRCQMLDANGERVQLGGGNKVIETASQLLSVYIGVFEKLLTGAKLPGYLGGDPERAKQLEKQLDALAGVTQVYGSVGSCENSNHTCQLGEKVASGGTLDVCLEIEDYSDSSKIFGCATTPSKSIEILKQDSKDLQYNITVTGPGSAGTAIAGSVGTVVISGILTLAAMMR